MVINTSSLLCLATFFFFIVVVEINRRHGTPLFVFVKEENRMHCYNDERKIWFERLEESAYKSDLMKTSPQPYRYI